MLCALLQLYLVVIFARILLSWIRVSPGSAIEPIARGIVAVTDPVMAPLRRAIPPIRLGAAALDVSPIVLILGIQLLIPFVC